MSAFLRSLARPATTTSRTFSTTAARPIARMTILGNLGATPELQATSTGREVVKYRVASNLGYGENRRTSWFHVSSFEREGPRRDLLLSTPKGSLIMVQGDASLKEYTDDTGKLRYALNIVQRSFDIVKRPSDGREQEQPHEQPQVQPQEQ